MCLAQVLVVLACQVSEALKLPEEGLQEFIKGSELTYFACPWSEMPAHERMMLNIMQFVWPMCFPEIVGSTHPVADQSRRSSGS